ncbi:MAG: S-layer homology domain-containing protein [Limnochordia bacterium]|nr:S-layer homology domain-containing protein [Bacillota bacterium]NLL07964.1 S-layer homology domain-containing protein [Bacillota bacterium]
MRPAKVTAFVVALMLLTLPSAAVLAAFADINGTWAESAITALDEKGLFTGLWTEEFAPSRSLSHAEALQLLASGFALTEEESEELAQWLNQLLVAHPEGITRGEYAALLGSILGLGEHTEAPKGFYPSFSDLNPDYPGFLGIELLQRLALLPTHMVGRFEPYRLLTRAEAAYILDQALRLREITGTVAEVQSEGRQLVLESAAEEGNTTLTLLAETLYISPGSLIRDPVSRGESLRPGQEVVVLARENQALLVRLEGETRVQALLEGLNKATQLLADVLTPEQINALITGNWDQLGEEVRYQVYQELVERGAAPWEAEAAINQDWSGLQLMLKERLTMETADYLDVAPELISAALDQNWSKVLEYAQVELAQRLLTSEWLQNIMDN